MPAAPEIVDAQSARTATLAPTPTFGWDQPLTGVKVPPEDASIHMRTQGILTDTLALRSTPDASPARRAACNDAIRHAAMSPEAPRREVAATIQRDETTARLRLDPTAQPCRQRSWTMHAAMSTQICLPPLVRSPVHTMI